MKIIVCGGRRYPDWDFVVTALDTLHSLYGFSLVMQGESGGYDKKTGTWYGADILGKRWAKLRGVPVESFPAMWSRGISAGFERNLEMLNRDPDTVVAFPGNNGTEHMIKISRKRGVRVIDLG